MTIAEIIEELQKHPPYKTVAFRTKRGDELIFDQIRIGRTTVVDLEVAFTLIRAH